VAVKLRLMRMGKKKQPTYRIVVADSRSPRDGRFIEILGTYAPRAEPSLVAIDHEKAIGWLEKGAQPLFFFGTPTMPKRFIDKAKSRTFQVCFKPYDDVTYEDERSRATMCLRKIGGKTVQYEPDFERAWGIKPVLNMYEADDTEPMESTADCLFKEAEWADFDQEWIRAMCSKPDDESTAVLDMTKYPCHDPKLATSQLDRVYAKEMENFDQDYELEQDDERLQGPLPIDAYEAALDEWILHTRKVNMMTNWKGEDCEIGADHSGSVRFALPKAVREHAFHADSNGVFLTVLQPKDQRNPFVDYHRERKAALRLTKERARADPEVAEECEEIEDDEKILQEMFPDKPKDPWDCETIISTYSNLENHPELIQEQPLRKIRLSAKTGIPTPAALRPPPERDEDDELVERLSAMTSTTSLGRPKDETIDEKRERKKLIKAGKQLQRERKKELKAVFQAESVNQRWELQTAETQRRRMLLSLGLSTL